MSKTGFIWMVAILLITGCTLEKKTPMTTEANINEDIEMLSYVFSGNYSKNIIKESMDILFIKYKIKPERYNYLRIGNTLIDYRKQSNGQFEEMDIINYMIMASNSDGQRTTFDNQLTQAVKRFKAKM